MSDGPSTGELGIANGSYREISIKTEKGEEVKVEIIHDTSVLTEEQKDKLAQDIANISEYSEDEREALKFKTHPIYQSDYYWYFLKDNNGQVVSYGRVSPEKLEDGRLDGYIGTIATRPDKRQRGYAGAILDTIISDGYDRLWAFNAIAGTKAGDRFREMHERKGFVADYSQGNQPILTWNKVK